MLLLFSVNSSFFAIFFFFYYSIFMKESIIFIRFAKTGIVSVMN